MQTGGCSPARPRVRGTKERGHARSDIEGYNHFYCVSAWSYHKTRLGVAPLTSRNYIIEIEE